ncbi:MAG TPA: cytochrome P450 [Phycisphaerae bacterium]
MSATGVPETAELIPYFFLSRDLLARAGPPSYHPRMKASPKLLKLPPGPRSPIPGTVFRQLRRGPLEFLTKLTHDYGDISSFRAVGQLYVVINSPDLAQEILQTRAAEFWKGPALQNSKGLLGEGLLTAEGDVHRRQRKLMQPAFHAKQVETYSAQVLSSTNDLITQWKKLSPNSSRQLDIRPEMMGLALVIAGRALFGAILDSDIKTVHRCMDDLMNNYVRAVVPWGKLLNLLPLPSTRKLARARQDLITLVDRMIAARRAEITAGNTSATDLLSRMIAATDQDGPPERSGCPVGGVDGAGGKGAPMSDTQLRDQALTILTAGHETTANAMTFTLYLLAKYPVEQNKLRNSLSGRPDQEFQSQDSPLGHVLLESMRLYPPAWTVGRQNQTAMDIGGYHLPKKCTILIPQWTLHRDARFFPRSARLQSRPLAKTDPSAFRLHSFFHGSEELHRRILCLAGNAHCPLPPCPQLRFLPSARYARPSINPRHHPSA